MNFREIVAAFCLQGELRSVRELPGGNVHGTYLLGVGEKNVLAQKLNTVAFRDPETLMQNVGTVLTHLRAAAPERIFLRYYETPDGKTFWNGEGGIWRVCDYIPSVSITDTADLRAVRSAGSAYGEFLTMLSDLEPSRLRETIPAFHDTRKRFEDLSRDAERDPCGRLASAGEELSFLYSVRDRACVLTDLFAAGELPLRVTHNDTKLANVLFDETTRDAIAVIDLDTVMPGLVGHDFGDAVRSAANTAGEDCTDPSRVKIDLSVYRAFSDGFLEKTARMLTDTEIRTLAPSCFAITCELAARFLDDYLVGDRYFRIRFPEQNLARAKCQIALAKDMLSKMKKMNAIALQSAEKYR